MHTYRRKHFVFLRVLFWNCVSGSHLVRGVARAVPIRGEGEEDVTVYS